MKYRAIAPKGLKSPEFGGRKVPELGLEVSEAEARELGACGFKIEPELPPQAKEKSASVPGRSPISKKAKEG